MASTREWFETVEEARRRARRHLPRSVYMALVAGSEQGVTLRDNVAAFSELRFTPPHIGERLINHVAAVTTEVERIYDRHNYLAEMQAAVER